MGAGGVGVALRQAARDGQSHTLQLLLEARADVASKDGAVCLFCAAWFKAISAHKHTICVLMLLRITPL